MCETRHHLSVSIILPIYNAEIWLDACLQSVLDQTYNDSMELCIYDDASTDKSMEKVSKYREKLLKRDVAITVAKSDDELLQPKGCGFAKNQAVKVSRGEYLCFLDADDVMLPERVEMQLNRAMTLPRNSIIGCQVVRDPPDSTTRYTNWINNLTTHQLHTQIYTSNGPTIVMPTWFCHRSVFVSVGGFDEGGKGVPEDYLFFLKFIALNGNLSRVDKPLLVYRHHLNATTFSVLEKTIWNIRIKELEKTILPNWKSFTIWNAGKQGRRLYRDLSDENRAKVTCFCDVDVKKISKGFYKYELSESAEKTKVPIVHFKDATKPFVVCMKLDLTGGAFETNLNSLNLQEGNDYVMFS